MHKRQMAGIAALIGVANYVQPSLGPPSQAHLMQEEAVNEAGLSAFWGRLRQDHMTWNSLYLVLMAGLQSGFGFTFWILAAHLFTASDVGRASALISATSVIGFLALLGLNNAMGRYLPTSYNRDALISSGLALVAICGAALALSYICLTPFVAPRLTFVEKSPALTVGFVLITAAGALNVLTNSVFIASRKAKYTTFVDGIVAGFGKIALVVALAGPARMDYFSLQQWE